MTGDQLVKELTARIEAGKIDWHAEYDGYSGTTKINRKDVHIHVWKYQSGTEPCYRDHAWERESEPVYSIDARITIGYDYTTIKGADSWLVLASNHVYEQRRKAEQAEQRKKDAAERRTHKKESQRRKDELDKLAKGL